MNSQEKERSLPTTAFKLELQYQLFPGASSMPSCLQIMNFLILFIYLSSYIYVCVYIYTHISYPCTHTHTHTHSIGCVSLQDPD